ncbi:MAG: LytTR family DNA-binding domain-containing protein [Treponema sp.]|jgi:DNA-binding LytR/AlgR family response regulator|nr:LytTR family DNA-binding domain-containing protein [Treponema sp.]
MTQVAIVEDNFATQELLWDYLHRYEIENQETFEIALFRDGAEIIQNYRPRFDIILLDVRMETVDGFTAAKHIRTVDEHVILIFVTNMGQYAIKGYEVDALSYLLKPVPYSAFSREIKRSLQRLRQSTTQQHLTLFNESGFTRLDMRKILYVERDRHRVLVHTEDRVYSAVGTIKSIEAKLDTGYFSRCNSGYIVNMAHVTEVKDNCVLVGKHRLSISRPKKKAFMTALTDYFGSGLT